MRLFEKNSVRIPVVVAVEITFVCIRTYDVALILVPNNLHKEIVLAAAGGRWRCGRLEREKRASQPSTTMPPSSCASRAAFMARSRGPCRAGLGYTETKILQLNDFIQTLAANARPQTDFYGGRRCRSWTQP